jgi:chemotaxis protein MotA
VAARKLLWHTIETMSKSTWLGLLIGIGAIILGHLWEGGHLESLMQGAAFIIVMGGTLGAVLISNPERDLKLAIALMKATFTEDTDVETKENIKDIVECSRIAKKESVVAIESHLKGFKDPFFKRVLRNVIDGVDPQIIRDTFEVEISSEEDRLNAAAKVWADAGGFAPTIGIIGAVLGLIHVMGNLSDTSKLGEGIAVAFVATIYGVVFANLIFLPVAFKIKKKIQHKIHNRYLILEGALMINQGLSALLVDQKLQAYLEQQYQKVS